MHLSFFFLFYFEPFYFNLQVCVLLFTVNITTCVTLPPLYLQTERVFSGVSAPVWTPSALTARVL